MVEITSRGWRLKDLNKRLREDDESGTVVSRFPGQTRDILECRPFVEINQLESYVLCCFLHPGIFKHHAI